VEQQRLAAHVYVGNLFGRRSHWGIGYGPGFSVNYWHTNLNIETDPGGGPINYTYLPNDSSYKSNRFSASYFDFPVEMRFRSNSNNKGRYYRLYFGGLIGYRINSFSQFKTDNFNVNMLKSMMFRAGIMAFFCAQGTGCSTFTYTMV
jgi:hypothetical protein